MLGPSALVLTRQKYEYNPVYAGVILTTVLRVDVSQRPTERRAFHTYSEDLIQVSTTAALRLARSYNLILVEVARARPCLS